MNPVDKLDCHSISPFTKGVSQLLIENHLHSLNAEYFRVFSPREIGFHIYRLSLLDQKIPVDISILPGFHDEIECTVFAYDTPFLFSCITGILSQAHFNIIKGHTFTYGHSIENNVSDEYTYPSLKNYRSKRFIIDHFVGTLTLEQEFNAWATEIRKSFKNILQHLYDSDTAVVERTKQKVNEVVAQSLELIPVMQNKMLSPISINIYNDSPAHTHIRITAHDTPFFLYSLSTALSLHNVLIDQVHISTSGDQLIDDFYITDQYRKKIVDNKHLDQLRFSILFTKQFTFFLGSSPHPYAALIRFETIMNNIIDQADKSRLTELIQKPSFLKDLAQVLGTSDFIWEDFIRGQYETIFQMLSDEDRLHFEDISIELLKSDLDSGLQRLASKEDKIDFINQFKDKESFRIDIFHIIMPSLGFNHFSKRLTELAELIVSEILSINYHDLVLRYGRPRTSTGAEVRYALCALGKFGGAALGYASDIELFFIYSDAGTTSGPDQISNSEFYELLVRNLSLSIRAKREGIFRVDMRLRPYGDDGPLAVSLNQFISYYHKEGSAHSAERLALVRLRPISGDSLFCSRIERIRNELIYTTDSVKTSEISTLRELQFKQKNIKNRLNAKFSPGTLVDLEYAVQLLQVQNGNFYPSLRTPILYDALETLKDTRLIEKDAFESLLNAYIFFRNLINGLRMLRGSAQDLFLPEEESSEMLHLARRIGYKTKGNFSSAQQLIKEFETHTASIRSFLPSVFGTHFVTPTFKINLADMILDEKTDASSSYTLLASMSFRFPERAFDNFRRLSGQGKQKVVFSRIAVLAGDILSALPDPDMALNHWEQFAQRHQNILDHFNILLEQPERLSLFLNIFSASNFLSETLIRNPYLFDDLMKESPLEEKRSNEIISKSLATLMKKSRTEQDWLDNIRIFRRKEILRIVSRDIHFQIPLPVITKELSLLADEIVRSVLKRSIKELTLPLKTTQSLSIMAFGKLGGEELNYSSDIDLLFLYHKNVPHDVIEKVIKKLIYHLTSYTNEGRLYRVDLRLRPHGLSGLLAFEFDKAVTYYETEARLWELQALIKLRPIAGNLTRGLQFIQTIKHLLTSYRHQAEIVKSILSLREKTIHRLALRNLKGFDVKNSFGGIRDIEFLVQGLVLIHAHQFPTLINSNTLQTIGLLHENGILPKDFAQQIISDYLFLRKIEHYLQIYDDTQTHVIPHDINEREKLAKRVLGNNATCQDFDEQLYACTKRVYSSFLEFTATDE
jgi:glutamate-ammonia-ligase adenylyltransferase